MRAITSIGMLILLFRLGVAQNLQNQAVKPSKPKFKGGFSYAYGPEVGLLLYPKANIDYYYNNDRTLYIGLDGSINVFIAIWGHVGFQAGFQIKNVYLESGIDLTFFEIGNYLSLNPKMGYDIPLYERILNIYFEIGPSYMVRSNKDLLGLKYLQAGRIPLNLEIGLNVRF